MLSAEAELKIHYNLLVGNSTYIALRDSLIQDKFEGNKGPLIPAQNPSLQFEATSLSFIFTVHGPIKVKNMLLLS